MKWLPAPRVGPLFFLFQESFYCRALWPGCLLILPKLADLLWSDWRVVAAKMYLVHVRRLQEISPGKIRHWDVLHGMAVF